MVNGWIITRVFLHALTLADVEDAIGRIEWCELAADTFAAGGHVHPSFVEHLVSDWTEPARG